AEVLQASAASFLQAVREDGATLAAQESDVQESDVQESILLVVAEPRTNSLLITAPAAVQQRIAELLPQLDAPQPQVNIQVRIQEISSQAALNLGLNLSAGLGNFAATVLEGGLNFVFDPESVLSGLTIGAVLDTLESQRLSRRVDDSNLTVLNNGEARIQAGGTIFISLVGANATIEREIPYGVQVGVTPQIAADGRIQLTVEARVEDVLSEIDNPNFVNLSTRNVLSTISVLPGQTVVLGGLLQNSLTTSESRVPVLGSLPIIGGLFRSTSSSEDSVELLLIINAVIID
ncbi:MAG: hypothetical protein H0X64_03870, partial [Gemmatimonadaceae bacterium]|nr:hypothetical protein [Gemmatimonadaceae bacterium]